MFETEPCKHPNKTGYAQATLGGAISGGWNCPDCGERFSFDTRQELEPATFEVQ